MSARRRPNRLAEETSPLYLLQHSRNPVDWFPWGPEAIARARRENKPIFLSIGYAACHWCHVMERESFENEAIASILNERFVPIKVDREERPDLDEIYMTSVQLIVGHGGWPLSLFLTPDHEPFYGGTNWPPDDRDRLQCLAPAYHGLGRRREADQAVATLAESARTGSEALQVAEVYAFRADPDRAFEWLQRAREGPDGAGGSSPGGWEFVSLAASPFLSPTLLLGVRGILKSTSLKTCGWNRSEGMSSPESSPSRPG